MLTALIDLYCLADVTTYNTSLRHCNKNKKRRSKNVNNKAYLPSLLSK